MLSEAAALLDTVEADYRRALYKARWDEVAAQDIVPRLIALLASDDRDILLRTLRAFVTIGPMACDAAGRIAGHLDSSDPLVSQAAVIGLMCVSLKTPECAVQPLIKAAKRPGNERCVMQALIGFGKAAKAAAPVFARHLDHPSASMRRLALRGLVAIAPDTEITTEVLRRATSDKSKEVREYAFKHLPGNPVRGRTGGKKRHAVSIRPVGRSGVTQLAINGRRKNSHPRRLTKDQ